MPSVPTKLKDHKDYSQYPFMNFSLVDMKGEKWEDIPGMDGYFKVSNYGRVWALERPVVSVTGQFYFIRERIRKQGLFKYYNSFSKDYTEQLAINLRYNHKSFHLKVSRLVYHLFIAPIDFKEDRKPVVHKDGDNCNNRVENLILMNGTQLYGHGLKIKRRPRAGTTTKSKNDHLIWNETNYPRAIVKYTLEGKVVKEYESMAEAAKANHTTRSSVRKVTGKETKQLNGFVYRYKGDLYRGEHADFSWEKPVTQYSIEGKRIGSYPSVKEASVQTGIDAKTISKCALRKFLRGGGYVWRYQGDHYKGEYKGAIKNTAKPIVQYTPDGKVINRFESISKASIETGFNTSILVECANKRTKVSHGYVWRYADDIYKGEYKNYQRGKPVTQLTLAGKKIQTYLTIESAARTSGLTPDNIQKNVKGENKTAGGFVWRVATEKEIKALPPNEQLHRQPSQPTKEVIQYSIEGKKVAHYNTIAQAAKTYNTSRQYIYHVLDKPTRTYGGFVWRSKGNPYRGELAKNPSANTAQAVTQYDLNGKRAKVFSSMLQAEKETGIYGSAISQVARGKLKTTGGFIWKTDTNSKTIDVDEHFASTRKHLSEIGKRVIKYSLEGKRLAEFPSIAAAARAEGVRANTISRNINNKQKSALGFIWKLKEEYEDA